MSSTHLALLTSMMFAGLPLGHVQSSKPSLYVAGSLAGSSQRGIAYVPTQSLWELVADSDCRSDAARAAADEQQAKATNEAATKRYYVEADEKIAQVYAKHSREIAELGFKKDFLSASIMSHGLRLTLDWGKYERVVTFEQFLALAFETGQFTSIRKVTIANGQHTGVLLKVSGTPARFFVFRQEDNELYLAGEGEGEPSDFSSTAQADDAATDMAALCLALRVRITGLPPTPISPTVSGSKTDCPAGRTSENTLDRLRHQMQSREQARDTAPSR